MESLKTGQITQLWNPIILRVLLNSVKRSKSTLFGITGDIDNLGKYVANNGRAKAENLVDLYNQIIRNEMNQWVNANAIDLEDFAFVASGEEILIIGLAHNVEIINKLFDKIHTSLNNAIRTNPFIDIEETTISFGCSIFNDKSFISHIDKLIEIIDTNNEEAGYKEYLNTMELIREQLAIDLDKSKFHNLNLTVNGNEILYRNLVYTHLQKYKQETAESLVNLSEILDHSADEVSFELLRKNYGLNEQNKEEVLRLKQKLNIQ